MAEEDDPAVVERLAIFETDMKWVKEKLSQLDRRLASLDNRVWYIVAGIIVVAFLQVAFKFV